MKKVDRGAGEAVSRSDLVKGFANCRDRLADLRADAREAKSRIRATLDELAERHGIPTRDVTYAMGYVDDMLSDMIYDLERELEHRIEQDDPV